MIGQTIPQSHKREAERHRAETEANRHLIREIPMGVTAEADKISRMRTDKERRELKQDQYRKSERRRNRDPEGLPKQKGELTGTALKVLKAFEQRGTWAHRSEIEPLAGISGQALSSVIQRLRNAGHLERSQEKPQCPSTGNRQFMYRAVR